MHMYCDYKCPSDCPNRLWRYWNGTTKGDGSWERDENFKVKQGMDSSGTLIVNTLYVTSINKTVRIKCKYKILI